MNLTWSLKSFNELTPGELYEILRLRSEVFVMEQQCVFADIDGKDPSCYHLMARYGEALFAYTRIVPPGVSYPEASIGRVVTAKEARFGGIGKILILKSIVSVYDLYGKVDIRIGAQLYLKKFYESFGFEQTSEMYFEDGIEHIDMVKP